MSQVKPYFQDDSSKKDQVSKMFNNIAPYYDLLNRVLSLGIDKSWRNKMIRQLQNIPHHQILDVATGTADVAIAMGKKLQPQRIIGLDIAVEMLDIGRKKIQQEELSDTIHLMSGDAEDLPFEDNTFDAITVAFGVRNFEHLEKGLAEMLRVLKTGGKLVVLEFSKPQIFPFKQLFQFYFKYILPFIGKWTSKDPKAYRYLYESVQAFPDGAAFLDLLSKTGFISTQQKALTLGISSIYLGYKK